MTNEEIVSLKRAEVDHAITRDKLATALHQCGELTPELESGETWRLAERCIEIWREVGLADIVHDAHCSALSKALADARRELADLKARFKIGKRFQATRSVD